MIEQGRNRTVIAAVSPQIDEGRYPVKRIIGEKVHVLADIFADGHVKIAALLLYRRESHSAWTPVWMIPQFNDRWSGSFTVQALGLYEFTLVAWVDHFKTWQSGLQKKIEAADAGPVDRETGLRMIREALQWEENEELKIYFEKIENAENPLELLLDPLLHLLMRNHPYNQLNSTEYDKILQIGVDPKKAEFSAWYEMFPRSSGQRGGHGSFRDCVALLPSIEQMGFDVLYFPPIHPIGRTKRKGRNNQLMALDTDPGSPWAIGSHEGGHHAIHPLLGTLQDFRDLVEEAKSRGIDIAIDLAFQCSPDHPYIQEHPEWFLWRPDGSIQYAENPPKKYEDIVPFNFECSDWQELWLELRNIVFYWIEKGITIFRVDNPHTKPFPFWEWLIRSVKQKYPEVIFLSEAFTRPKVMAHLAKIGFNQSYTYFAWRHTKNELMEYVSELTSEPIKEFFRPNFWPNTPDILTEELQKGGKGAFIRRLILAATLSSNYGLYGPPFELMISQAVEDTEEYLDAEKYESHYWEKRAEDSLIHLITRLNAIRKGHPALQKTNNIHFIDHSDSQLLCYAKKIDAPFNALLIVVNLLAEDREVQIKLPLKQWGLNDKSRFTLHELLADNKIHLKGESLSFFLHSSLPAAIFNVIRSG